MGKINSQQKRKAVNLPRMEARTHPQATKNFEGGLAYDYSNLELKLFSQVASALIGEDSFYQSAQDKDAELYRTIHAMMEENPEFVLQMAKFARNKLNLRTVPIVLLGEAAKRPELYVDECSGQSMIRRYIPAIVRRADEITEILAYLADGSSFGDWSKGNMLPNAVRRGLQAAIHNFDEYQLSKYDRDSGSFKMRDAIRLIHPKPMDKSESALYKYLIEPDFWNLDVAEEAEEMEDLLPKTYHKKMMLKKEKFTPAAIAHMDQGHVTWEVATTHFGNKKEVWEACLPNMGYMAVLRNLRNMLQAGISETHLADLIADDPERVKKSRQLPFRFFSASKVIGNEYTEVQDALARAFDISVENVPLKTGKTLVAIDFSASMEQPISKKSSVSIKEVGMCMGAIAVKLTHGAVCIFGNDIKWEPLRSTDSMVTNVNLLYQDRRAVGQATYAHLVLDDAIRKSLFFDRIILLSDMQCYSEGSMYGCDYRSLRESLLRYRRDINPRATFISVDLEGYGTVQMPDDDPQVMLVGGWNDAIYRLIDVWENGEDYLEEVRSL